MDRDHPRPPFPAPTLSRAHLAPQLLLNKGVSPATGARVVSEAYVAAATTPDAPHLMPGEDNAKSDYPYFGYGFQLWVGPKPEARSEPGTDFLAIGVYGQMIYVSPDDGVVIAKTAAYPGYKEEQRPGSHENYVETMGYEALRAIAKHVTGNT